MDGDSIEEILEAEQLQRLCDLINEIAGRPDALARFEEIEAALESIANSGEFPDEVDV